jgi:hypothetical protein
MPQRRWAGMFRITRKFSRNVSADATSLQNPCIELPFPGFHSGCILFALCLSGAVHPDFASSAVLR